MRTPHTNILYLLTYIMKKQKVVKEGHNRMSTKVSCTDEHHTLTKNRYIGSCSCFMIFPIIHLATESKIHVAHPNYLGLRLIMMMMMMTTFSKEGVYRFRGQRKDISHHHCHHQQCYHYCDLSFLIFSLIFIFPLGNMEK